MKNPKAKNSDPASIYTVPLMQTKLTKGNFSQILSSRPPIKIEQNYVLRYFAARLTLHAFTNLNKLNKTVPSTAILGYTNHHNLNQIHSPVSLFTAQQDQLKKLNTPLAKIISLSRLMLVMKRVETAVNLLKSVDNIICHFPTVYSYNKCEIKIQCENPFTELINNQKAAVQIIINTSLQPDSNLTENINNLKIIAVHYHGNVDEVNATVSEITNVIKRCLTTYHLTQCSVVGRAIGWNGSILPSNSSIFNSEKISSMDGGWILTNSADKHSVMVIGHWPIPRVFVTAPKELSTILDEKLGDQKSNIFPLRKFLKSRIQNAELQGTAKNGFEIIRHHIQPENLIRDRYKWKNLPTYYREVDLKKFSGQHFLYKLESLLFALTSIWKEEKI